MNEHTRAYIYRVLLAVVPILTAYGVVEESKTAVIVGLIGAVFGNGLAVVNTSTGGK